MLPITGTFNCGIFGLTHYDFFIINVFWLLITISICDNCRKTSFGSSTLWGEFQPNGNRVWTFGK